MFDLAYFFNSYAKILMKLGKNDEALALLDEVDQYNPHYAAAHLNRCKIFLDKDNIERAKEEFGTAQNLLAGADKNFIIVQELVKISPRLEKADW